MSIWPMKLVVTKPVFGSVVRTVTGGEGIVRLGAEFQILSVPATLAAPAGGHLPATQ